MANVNCDHLIDYLNGTLDEQQHKQFEAHIAECPECREIIDMTGELPYLAEPVEPNAGMKARILDAAFGDEVHEQPIAESPSERANVVPMASPKRKFTSSKWTPLVAAALLVSLLGNAYAFYELNDRTDDGPEAPQVAFETIEMQPSESFSGTATAAVVHEADTLNLLVQANQLAPTSGDEVYQVWLLKDGQPIPTGAFTPGEDNEGAVFYALEQNTEDWDTIAVTLEPQRGNTAPEGEIVLSAAF